VAGIFQQLSIPLSFAADRLMPAPDGGDDFLGIGGPCERLGLPIVILAIWSHCL